MSSALRERSSRPSRTSLSEAGPVQGENGAPPAPTIRVRWYPARVPPKEKGRGQLKSWSPVVALTSARGQRKAIANEVPLGRPGRYAIETAVREALSGLDGRWRARIAPLDAISVEIVSPDGFRWLAFIPNPGRQKRRGMARRLKDACRRPLISSGPTRWTRAWILVTEESC